MAEINLLRRFVRYLLRQDDIVFQSSGLNAPTHQSSGEKSEPSLDEFPNARALLIDAKIVRTIEDIHVLKSDMSLSYSYRTKTWSRDTAGDIRGVGWNCAGLLKRYSDDGSSSVRQFLRNLENELISSDAREETIILTILSPDHVGVKLIINHEQWVSVKQGYWVIIDDCYDIPHQGAFQYIFSFNGPDVGKLHVIRVPIETTVGAHQEVVFDGDWGDPALGLCGR